MADACVTVIGGGVVGLAVAAELSRHYSPLFLLERYPKVGQETSSRNSEVIHAGIYYPSGSLKARLCVEGREMLYRLCESHGIPHRRITKIITATQHEDLGELERLEKHGKGNGVNLIMLTADKVRELEPQIVTVGGVFSPGTGIISAHGLMDYFFHAAREQGRSTPALRHAATGTLAQPHSPAPIPRLRRPAQQAQRKRNLPNGSGSWRSATSAR